MSKSVGNVIDPFTLASRLRRRSDAVFLPARSAVRTRWQSYSHEAIVNRINADLANDLGNLAQRSLSMIAQAIARAGRRRRARWRRADEALLCGRMGASPSKARAAMADFSRCIRCLADIWKVVADANRYFAAEEPWKLAKTDAGRMATVLWTTAETLRVHRHHGAAGRFRSAAGKLLDLLGVGPDARTFSFRPALIHRTSLSAATPLPSPAPIFPRYVDPEEPTQPKAAKAGKAGKAKV